MASKVTPNSSVLHAQAISFAEQGRYNEALALWTEQKKDSHHSDKVYDQYLTWLILAGSTDLSTHLSQLSAEQLDKTYPKFSAILGALILAGHSDLHDYLPPDSTFLAHLQITRTALQALDDKNDTLLIDTLKQLPYRSAFKDFRIILTAINLSSSSVEQAQDLLAKIPSHSIYFQIAQPLKTCLLEGAELAQSLLKLNHQQRSFIAEAKNLSETQREFIEQFCRQSDDLTDKIKFTIAIQYQSLVGTGLAQHFCQSLLASYPAGAQEFHNHFDVDDDFEENRVKALQSEQDNNIYDADYYWRSCLRALERSEGDNKLKMALILRHLAAQESELAEKIKLLEESIEHDTTDHNSYLQIIEFYAQQPTTHAEWLSKTLEQFPQDIDVLSLALNAAEKDQNHSQISNYANTILKHDPLNTAAKQSLFSSHLAYTQQLIRKKDFSAVEKGITQAETLSIGKTHHQQVSLLRALLCFTHEDKQLGLQKITKTIQLSYQDPINMRFMGTMIALLNDLSVETILDALPSTEDHQLSASELSQLIEQVSQYNQQTFLYQAFDQCEAPLINSLNTQEYSEALLLDFCNTLDSVKHVNLLQHYTKFCQTKWQKPIWMYYRIYADKKGIAEDCSFIEINRLQHAHRQAVQDKDHATSLVIESFLNDYYEVYPQRTKGLVEKLFGFNHQDEEDDSIEKLFGHIDEGVFIELNNKAALVAQQLSPERLINSLINQTDMDEQSILSAMMKNPDIFSALLILKSSAELAIDINVYLNDVITIFGITEKTSPFPFHF